MTTLAGVGRIKRSVCKNSGFYARLRSARKARGLGQPELAEKIGMTQSTIGMIESGERLPTIPVLRKLSCTLNVSSDYLIGLTEEMERT